MHGIEGQPFGEVAKVLAASPVYPSGIERFVEGTGWIRSSMYSDVVECLTVIRAYTSSILWLLFLLLPPALHKNSKCELLYIIREVIAYMITVISK